MPRTQQKKMKFSKGEINQKLLERQDLEILESSASYIKNITSTPYGGIRTRTGTKKIDIATKVLRDYIWNTEYSEPPSFDNLKDKTNTFTSFPINSPTSGVEYNVLLLDLQSAYNDIEFDFTDFRMSGSISSWTLKIYSSPDDVTYTLQSSIFFNIESGGTESNYASSSVSMPDGTRYIKVTATRNSSSINSYYFKALYLTIYELKDSKVKFAKFVFNNEQKYLLVLHDEVISVYENDEITETITATGLLETYFDRLKYTQSLDTMIFTHPDMVTKQLQRTSTGWVWSDFSFQNIPKYAFNGETITNPAVTLTPSAVEGSVRLTASGATFTSASVGQIIDGGGGRVRITNYVSTTVVDGYTIIPFYTIGAIASGAWDYITGYEDVWSLTRGYPNTCLFFNQSLWFGGSKSLPNSLWKSRTGEYTNFKNTANYDNDSIHLQIASNQTEEIVNIYGNRGIQIFTAGDEWIIPENALTPSTVSVVKNTSNGSLDTVLPVDISGTTLFIEKNGKSLLAYVYNDTQGAYVTSTMSLLSDMIDSPVGIDVDYNSQLDEGNYVYIVLEDGTMAVACILLDQKINSFVRFETDGNIKDVANVGSDTYILVERDSVKYIEKIEDYAQTIGVTDFTTEKTAIAGVVSGLSEYEGNKVYVYDDNQSYGSFTVSSGSVDTGESELSGTVYVGYGVEYELTSNKIAVGGKTNSIRRRIAMARIETINTETLTFTDQTKSFDNNDFEFFGITNWSDDPRYTISGTFDYMEILSIMLNISYGAR